MARDRGSYKEQRRERDGDAARGGPEDEDMFFGASPSEKAALRHTKDPKKMKLAELNLNAVDRDKIGAPEKIGENMRLIDIAMSDTDPPPAPKPRPARPATRPQPEPEPESPARRTPSDYVPTGEQGEIQGGITVQRPWRNRLERAAWVLAVLVALLGLGLPYALPAVLPELAVAAAAERGADVDPWGTPWDAREVGAFSLGPDLVPSDDDLQRPAAQPGSLAHWASWAREAALLSAGALVWLALTLSLTLDLRSASRVLEGIRVLILASLPALIGAGVLLWGADFGQAYGLPDPPGSLRGGVKPLTEIAAGALPFNSVWVFAGAWAGLCLLIAKGLRGRRPLRQTTD